MGERGSGIHHLLNTMVEAHCVRDKGTSANQWVIVCDWLRVVTLNHGSNTW